MKKLIMLVVGLLLLFLNNGLAQTENPVRMNIWALNGPHISNPGYTAWASNVVRTIYLNGNPDGALGYQLDPTMVTQPTTLTSNSIWYVVQVFAKSSNFKFNMANLKFVGNSSDAQNALGKTNLFNNANYVFHSGAYGILYGSGGRRFNDTVIQDGSYWSQTDINEAIFIGAQSKFFTYADGAGQANITNVLWSMPNFFTTGTWSLANGTNTYRTMKTLRLKGEPFPGILAIRNQTESSVHVGVTAGTNDTWTLMYSPVFPPSWSDVDTVNSGDSFDYPNVEQMGYWKLRLQ